MKPSDFSLISDYLTLANIENRTYTASIPGAVLPSSGEYTVDFTFNCTPSKQTITRAYMNHSKWNNANLWGVGREGSTSWNEGNEQVTEDMYITTPTDSTIKLFVRIQGNANVNISSHTIKIKVFRFKVPNVF